MTPCPDCAATREAPNGPRHCPTCLWCGARILSRILDLKGFRPAKELSTRATAALKVWMDHGHDEQQLRTLCASGSLIQPLMNERKPSDAMPAKTAKKR